MSITSVSFFSAAQTSRILPEENWGVISINNPGKDANPLKDGWSSTLRLWFHDIDESSIAAKLAGYEAMTPMQAQMVVDWVRKVEGSLYTIIVHCEMGVSRSAAIALWIAERHGLVDEYFSRKAALYNRYVYSLLNTAAHGPMVAGAEREV